MKAHYLIPLLFLTACSSTPKLVLRPQQPATTSADGIRYSEIVHAYHIGRYADPNDDSIMHEEHVVYRVEDNTRWNFHPGRTVVDPSAMPTRDVAFAAAPVNDAILAEVNSQKTATTEIMIQAKTLSAALAQFQTALQQTRTNMQETLLLRASVNTMRQRLDALESAQRQQAPFSPSTNANEPTDPLNP
ncbi:MAG TPA: hypothetical protein VGO67_22875 [Verrucomicrobiae bacterium]|jgi:hypothetical protein|nr:hypothetical protein [Verrucomicrobiae bacterium]